MALRRAVSRAPIVRAQRVIVFQYLKPAFRLTLSKYLLLYRSGGISVPIRRTTHAASVLCNSITAADEEQSHGDVFAVNLPENHRSWGLKTYRCTHHDDNAWSQFMTWLRTDTAWALEKLAPTGVMQCLKLDVIDDRATLKHAPKDDVRRPLQ